MPVATRKQLNAIGAFIVNEKIGDPEKAGELAYQMLDACGFDMTTLEQQTMDAPHEHAD